MCCKKILCVYLIVTLAFVFGCSKQGKNSVAKKASEIPEISKTSSKNSDTADIFKEFYSDDTSSKSSAKSSPKKSVSKSRKAELKSHTFSPAASTAAPAAEFSENGRYVVQVSCVKSRAFADKMVQGLKEKGYPAYVAEVQSPTPNLSGEYYRVRIGGLSAISTAKAFGENTLSQIGYQFWVDKKSNDKVGIEGAGLGRGSTNTSSSEIYERATSPASSWNGSPASSGSSTGSASSTTGSSGFDVSPVTAPAAVPAASPSPAVAPEKVPVAAAKTSSAPIEAKSATPTSSPSSSSVAPAAPKPAAAPSAPAAGGSPKSSGSSGSSEWGSDTSASGSGW